MPRRRISTALFLAALLLVPLAACGGSFGGDDGATDDLYACTLEVTNATTKTLVVYEWLLIEGQGGGDVLWASSSRSPNEIWGPGLELTVFLGPSFADVVDPSRLEWEVTFVDSEDVEYGPWTVPLADCGSTDITVTPADAS